MRLRCTADIAEAAKRLYSERLQAELEATHLDRYVAIEPESSEHFLAETFQAAVTAARAAHPDRISFVIHIGHPAAIYLEALTN